MEADQKKVLIAAYDQLVQNIADIRGVVGYLFSKQVMTSNIMARIFAEKTENDQTRALLDYLLRKPGVFDHFYNALVAKEESMAGLLKPGLRNPSGLAAGDPAPGQPGVEKSDVVPQLHHVQFPHKWPDFTLHKAEEVKVQCVSKDNTFMRKLFEDAARHGRSADTIHPYTMRQEFRGVFLLINNHDFSKAKGGFKNRQGTDKDQIALQSLFTGLLFTVIVKNDRTAKEIESDIREQFAADHSNFDCFACAILSHGGREGGCNVIYGVDGNSMPVDSIFNIAMTVKCPTLVGKPKLFFVQACQGDVMDKGQTVGDGPAGDAVDSYLPLQVESLHLDDKAKKTETAGLQPGEVTGKGEEEADSAKVASGGDLFMAVATVSGFQSLRNTANGSWFMQTLAYVFSKYAHLFDINDLMILINNLVSKAESEKGEKQQPVFNPAALKRKLYFFPGLSK